MIEAYSFNLIDKPCSTREVKTTPLDHVRKIMIEQIKEQQRILRQLKIDSLIQILKEHVEVLHLKEIALDEQLRIVMLDVENLKL